MAASSRVTGSSENKEIEIGTVVEKLIVNECGVMKRQKDELEGRADSSS